MRCLSPIADAVVYGDNGLHKERPPDRNLGIHWVSRTEPTASILTSGGLMIVTEVPGFAIDELVNTLGDSLKLPE